MPPRSRVKSADTSQQSLFVFVLPETAGFVNASPYMHVACRWFFFSADNLGFRSSLEAAGFFIGVRACDCGCGGICGRFHPGMNSSTRPFQCHLQTEVHCGEHLVPCSLRYAPAPG